MRRLTMFVAALAAAVPLACSPVGPTGTGMLNVKITDSPFSEAAAVLVTFSEVSAHRSGGGWETLSFAQPATERTCDLKKLENGVEDMLGVGALPAGHYTQIRLVVSRAALFVGDGLDLSHSPCAPSIADPGGTSHTLVIPSGEVRLNRQFTIEANDATTVLLDFHGDESIHQTGSGQYTMTPVITVISVS